MVTVRSRRWCWQGYNDGEQRWRAVRADDSAARQGEESPARSGERRAGCRSSTGCTEGRRGVVKAQHMAGEGGGGVGQSENRAEGLEVDEGTDL
jgi:hypothetical protein